MKKAQKIRKRPTVAEIKRLRLALRTARKQAREYYYSYQSEGRSALRYLNEIHDMKDKVAEAVRNQYRIINAFNAEKVGQWWKGAVRSRINGAVYFQPHDFAAHLSDNNCIIEREWLTDALCNEYEPVAGRIPHG